MPNPYHDAEGRFCSREEMAAAIAAAEKNGEFDTYFRLRQDIDNIDRHNSVDDFTAGTPAPPDSTETLLRLIKKQNLFASSNSVSLDSSHSESVENVALLSEPEKEALYEYTYDYHQFINHDLRHRAPDPGDPDKPVTGLFDTSDISEHTWSHSVLKEYCKLLDAVFSKTAKSTYRTVYRGVPFGFNENMNRKWLEENAVVGKIIRFPEYLSTSSDVREAEQFMSGSHKVMLEIATNQGVNVTSISQVPQEKEVLLPRDTRYIVAGVREDKLNNRTMVQLVAVSEKNRLLDRTNIHTPQNIPEPYITWEKLNDND